MVRCRWPPREFPSCFLKPLLFGTNWSIRWCQSFLSLEFCSSGVAQNKKEVKLQVKLHVTCSFEESQPPAGEISIFHHQVARFYVLISAHHTAIEYPLVGSWATEMSDRANRGIVCTHLTFDQIERGSPQWCIELLRLPFLFIGERIDLGPGLVHWHWSQDPTKKHQFVSMKWKTARMLESSMNNRFDF